MESNENPKRVGVCLYPTFELNITNTEMTRVEESWVGLKKSKYPKLRSSMKFLRKEIIILVYKKFHISS